MQISPYFNYTQRLPSSVNWAWSLCKFYSNFMYLTVYSGSHSRPCVFMVLLHPCHRCAVSRWWATMYCRVTSSITQKLWRCKTVHGHTKFSHVQDIKAWKCDGQLKRASVLSKFDLKVDVSSIHSPKQATFMTLLIHTHRIMYSLRSPKGRSAWSCAINAYAAMPSCHAKWPLQWPVKLCLKITKCDWHSVSMTW